MAAQAGIFSFFINYMTAEVPSDPGIGGRRSAFLHGWFETGKTGHSCAQRQGRVATWRPLAFAASWWAASRAPRCCKKFSAHKMLGLYGVLNVVATLLVFFKLGWLSRGCASS